MFVCSMGLVSFPLTSWETTRNTAITMNCGINMLMWIRLLRFYQCSSKLGPMWIMIRKMMAETFWFMAIFTMLVMSFGILIFAINVPSSKDMYEMWVASQKEIAAGDEATTAASSTSMIDMVSPKNSFTWEPPANLTTTPGAEINCLYLHLLVSFMNILNVLIVQMTN